jgi:hypothetical protein
MRRTARSSLNCDEEQKRRALNLWAMSTFQDLVNWGNLGQLLIPAFGEIYLVADHSGGNQFSVAPKEL